MKTLTKQEFAIHLAATLIDQNVTSIPEQNPDRTENTELLARLSGAFKGAIPLFMEAGFQPNFLMSCHRIHGGCEDFDTMLWHLIQTGYGRRTSPTDGLFHIDMTIQDARSHLSETEPKLRHIISTIAKAIPEPALSN